MKNFKTETNYVTILVTILVILFIAGMLINGLFADAAETVNNINNVLN